MKRVAMVTGASRGIGLELCRLLLEAGDTVVACPRTPDAEELERLSGDHPFRLHSVPMDVGDEASIAAAVLEVKRHVERIDLLFNNAGIYPRDHAGVELLDSHSLIRAFEVNAVGPLRVVNAFMPLLQRGEERRLIQVTSLMGSIQDNTSGGSYAYRMSKCALNMAVRNLGHELGPKGFLVLAIHPGWVRTRMGGGTAPLELRPAAEEVLRIALSATQADNGGFKGPGGVDLPY